MTLLSIFSRLEEPRRGPAKRYGLSEIIVMAICAVLCGSDDWVEVADWCEDEEEWLKGFLDLPHGTPYMTPLAMFSVCLIRTSSNRVSANGLADSSAS